MKRIFKKWKERWGVQSNRRFIIINLAFALAGSSVVYVRKPVFEWLGVVPDTDLWLKIVAYLVVVTPVYLSLLLLWGSLLGETRFFLAFEKKMLKKMACLLCFCCK